MMVILPRKDNALWILKYLMKNIAIHQSIMSLSLYLRESLFLKQQFVVSNGLKSFHLLSMRTSLIL